MPDAIRNRRNGRTHLDSGEVRPSPRMQPGHYIAIAACGRDIEDAERLPWGQAAVEDRCGQCARRKEVRDA